MNRAWAGLAILLFVLMVFVALVGAWLVGPG